MAQTEKKSVGVCVRERERERCLCIYPLFISNRMTTSPYSSFQVRQTSISSPLLSALLIYPPTKAGYSKGNEKKGKKNTGYIRAPTTPSNSLLQFLSHNQTTHPLLRLDPPRAVLPRRLPCSSPRYRPACRPATTVRPHPHPPPLRPRRRTHRHPVARLRLALRRHETGQRDKGPAILFAVVGERGLRPGVAGHGGACRV